MRNKRMLCLLTAGVMLTGCSQIAQEESELDTVPIATSTAASTLAVAEAEEVTDAHEQVALEVPEITRQEVKLNLEAEDAAIPEQCTVAVMPRLGYSGTGYLSGLDAKNGVKLTMQTEIPATQHYDITLVVGAGEACTCKILANGEAVYTLKTDAVENFVRVTVQGVFLSAGTCELSIEPVDGSIDVDCLELSNNDSLYEESAVVSTLPVDPQASDGAKKLYSFLKEQYGSKIITGQHVSDGTNAEIQEIYSITGKYPLIRFADLMEYSRNGGIASNATAISDSLEWAQDGGVVGLSWFWYAPTGDATVYAEDSSFDLSKAVTDQDIATATSAELTQMQQEGKISEECLELVLDIDAVAEAMQPLADADVPVLWRPLMEASGGWYWWGAAGAEAYSWLWNLMYTRMTSYHQLHNLLWVWNGQSSSYQVDSSTYDIAALDLYVDQEETYGSRYEQYVALRNMVPGKMLAISESSTIPDMNAMFRDNAVWSYFGLWYGTYLEDYTDPQALLEFYNSEGALTREDYSD